MDSLVFDRDFGRVNNRVALREKCIKCRKTIPIATYAAAFYFI